MDKLLSELLVKHTRTDERKRPEQKPKKHPYSGDGKVNTRCKEYDSYGMADLGRRFYQQVNRVE
ncbi:MAG: hypothetical protein R8K20_11335 [Gallionellaceae bacterium]